MGVPIIQYRPRMMPNGQKARGDREVWIGGECWGHVSSEGGRYRRLKLWNAKGSPVYNTPRTDGLKAGIVTVSKNLFNERHDGRTLLDLAEDAIRLAIKDGRLVPPSQVSAQVKAHREDMARREAETKRRRELMRATLVRLWHEAKAKSPAHEHVEALALAYEEIFCSPIKDSKP